LIAPPRARYRAAYRGALADFIDRVGRGLPPAVTFEDGYRALLIAEAARRAWLSGATVAIG
jgi:myo-inositol 2-dehydrogenase/D-chiro-inositol 1-dehydrogenase